MILATDELTGTYRREGLDPTLEHLLRESRATGAPLSLAVVDVDHFKTLNDGFGHLVGDAVLAEVARRLQDGLRDEDLVFRYGGDEFVAILPTTTLADAAPVLERIRRRVRERPVEAGTTVRVHLSVGVACSAELEGGLAATALFERADARLIRAKRRGRDRLVADDDEQEDGALPEVRLLGRDAQIAALEAFLATPRGGDPAAPGALRLTGSRGAGFGRMLQEAAARGELRGRSVRRVVGSPAGEGLHYGALNDAFAPEEDRLELTEETLRARLRSEADGPGLVLLVEGGEHLDVDSRALLHELAARPGTWTIEACPDDGRAALPESRRVRLAPLGPRQLEAWLRAALAGPPTDRLLDAAMTVGGGRPGPTARWLERGLRDGALRREADGWAWNESIAPLRSASDDEGGSVRVPRWEAPLVGRTALLARLGRELFEERLVVLVGPGGIGKSRLAAQLAHELSDGAPGGTDWIDLRALRRGDDLIAAVARDLRLGAVRDVGELARRMGDAPRRLVLDDAERIAGDAGQATELLAAMPGLRLLATARRPLRLDAERVVEVSGLDDPAQASALLRRHVRRSSGRGATIEPEAERALLAHLGGSPLAIELAAAWTRILPADALARELERRPGLLTSAPGLQRRTAETIDLTRELMSAPEQEMLGTLALLQDGFEAEEARRAVGASPFFLLALLDRALLRRDGARYRMHTLVAERFAAHLRDPATARRRLATAYAALAARLDGLAPEARSESGYLRVDAEIDNLRLAWATLLDPPDPAALWPLARLLRGWFDVRGRARDGLDLFQAADAVLDERHDVELRAWTRESVALFLAQRGRHEEAERTAGAALAMLAEAPATRTAALAHNTVGIARAYQGNVDGAREAFLRSAELRRALSDAVGEAQAHGNVALLLEQAGRPDEARAALRVSIGAYRTVGHASGLTLALSRLARLERHAAGDAGPGDDRRTAALALASEALEVADRIGYASAAEEAASELTETLLGAGRAADALPYAERAVAAARSLENADRERAARLRLGRAFVAVGRLTAAAAELERLDHETASDDRRARLTLAAGLAVAEGRLVDAGRLLGATAPGAEDGEAARTDPGAGTESGAATEADTRTASGTGNASGARTDQERWWRSAYADWRAALERTELVAEAEAAFACGRRDGPASLRPTGDDRRGSAA